MLRSLEALRTYVVAAIVLGGLAALGADLAGTAISASHTAQTVVLARELIDP